LVEVLIGVLNEFNFLFGLLTICSASCRFVCTQFRRNYNAAATQDACNGRDAARAPSPSPVEVGTASKIVVKCPRMVHQFVQLNLPDRSIRRNVTVLSMQRALRGESELSDWSC
jgi:hypothetical protein